MDTDICTRFDTVKLTNAYTTLWENTPDTFPERKIQFTGRQQKEKEAAMDSFSDELIQLIRGFPGKYREASERWGTALKRLLYCCGTGILGFDDESMRLLLDDSFCKSTSDFVEEARRFDAGFKTDEILQALRNVWIMNCMQLMMGHKVAAAPSVFAYSMLYPYTDNYLDSRSVSAERKERINARLERRLAGDCLKAFDDYEDKLFRLVEIIEGQFGRESNPFVYKSLLGIHSAQRRSLRLHLCGPEGGGCDIAGISFEKGGASVLADAYLLKGSLTPREASFAFGFGVLLQLLDDLQDAAADRWNGHHTLFSGKIDFTSSESNTNRLFNFAAGILDGDRCFNTPEATAIKNLIKKSVDLLLLWAVANNSGMYRRDYLSRLETYSPISFGGCKRQCGRLEREYSKLKVRLAVKPLEVQMAKAFAAGRLQ